MFKEFHYLMNELKSNKYQIFCDMDGVLCDFEKQTKTMTGKTCEELDKVSEEHFWSEIKKVGIEFWSHMPKLSDTDKLWSFIKPHGPKILSAPARSIEFCVDGKKSWIKKHLGSNVESIFVRARDKAKYANPNSILIDDLEKNINSWRSNNGIGILHKNSEDTIRQLKALGIN